MSSLLAVPPELIRDAIARIDANGQLVPVTDAMRRWLATFGDHLEQLPMDEDQRVSLQCGEPVRLIVSGGCWQLRRHVADSATWLVVQDIAPAQSHAAGQLELARCRALGKAAATLVHDLNNQFHSVLALSAQLDAFIQQPDERLMIRELERGTKVGSRMASSLARMLTAKKSKPEVLDPRASLREALSMVQNGMQHSGVAVQVASEQCRGLIRGAHVEVVQAIMAVLSVLQHAGPGMLRCTMYVQRRAIAGGRERDCVVLQCHAAPLPTSLAASILAVVQSQLGALAHVVSNPAALEGLVNAVFAMKRWGGDLTCSPAEQELTLECVWPVVCRSPKTVSRANGQ